ncbi:acetyl-CoA synthetase-like protein [Biscogniauxia marginata]|nr:acetyl-CoA synthetase-like protein [Biscogniauxia marginata]
MAPRYGSRLMPNVVDEIARQQPDLTYAFTPLTINVRDSFKAVTFSEIANATNRLAIWIQTNIGRSSRFDTIAYMGLGDLRYVAVFLAAVKCGYKVLLPSLRNSAWMNASLLKQTDCSHVLYAPEVEALVNPLLKERPDLRIHKVLPLEELIRSDAKHYPFDKEYEDAKWDPILILHSSGSTGPPKPIHMNHATFAVGDNDRNLLSVPGKVNQNWALWDFPKKEVFFSAFPAFHLAGFCSMIMLPIYYSNATLVLAPPTRPPTGQMLNAIMDYFTLKSIFCPPIIAEQLVQEPGGVDKCKDLKFLLYAGGPLSQAAGTALSKVTDVCQFYGQTETGPIQALVPRREDWASLEWHPMQEAIMEHSVDGTYEMVMKRNPALEGVRSISCNFPDVEVWRTKDLFRPHPTKSGLWTFHGRTDDIIVLSNGEKFNPVPSETHIAAHPLLAGAMVSGQDYPQASLVLEPKEHPRDQGSFIDELWSTIEEANAQAPGHARITKAMIICSSPSKPFDRTGKGTVIRSSTGKKYEREIAQLYMNDAPGNTKTVELGASPDLATVIKFTNEIITCAFPGHNIKQHEDLYTLGLDSLQTTEVVSLLKSGIRSRNQDADVSWISTRFVYEHPSIEALAGAMLHHLDPTTPAASEGGVATLNRVQKMKNMIEKYTQDLPRPRKLGQPEGTGYHVVITGSTGTLGTQLLARLLSDPNVATIRCLDRSAGAKERVTHSLASWSPPRAIDNSRVSFHQADYSQPGWGLPSPLASELRNTANLVVIHNAWKVDFNHSLDSFETVHVRGVRNLVDFAAKCAYRPCIVFVSSLSTVLNWADITATVPEHLPPTPEAAQPLGYAESKAAATESAINASVIRIGQIAGPAGDSNSGVWNAHEWFPLLLKTSKALGKVPDGRALGMIDWVPSDIVASAIWEIATATAVVPAITDFDVTGSALPLRVFHVANPAPVVSMREWVRELETVGVRDQEAMASKPAVKVLDFFRDMAAAGEGGRGRGRSYLGAEDLVFSTEEARRLSRSLADMGPVREEWMERWMDCWGI